LVHLVELRCATFDFKLLEEQLLELIGDRDVVQQAVGQQVFCLLKEGIAAIEESKKLDDLVKLHCHNIIVESLEAARQVLVSVRSDVTRCHDLLVHEMSEGLVSSPLEQHAIIESIAYQIINLFL